MGRTRPAILPKVCVFSPPNGFIVTRADEVFPIDTLKQNPLTDDKNVAAIQGGVAEGVGGQLSSGGLLGGIGDMSSKEGMNRVERGELDPSKLEDIKKKEQGQKGWTETLSGGYMGGSGGGQKK